MSKITEETIVEVKETTTKQITTFIKDTNKIVEAKDIDTDNIVAKLKIET